MQMIKKVISVVLAVIMIASVFAFSSTAGAPTPSGSYKVNMAYELVDETGKPVTTVKPGSTVTLNVYVNSSVANDEMTGFAHSIYYDDSIYTYVVDSVKWSGITKWIDANNSKVNVENAVNGTNTYTKQSALWTDEDKTNEPNWDSFLYVTGVQNTTNGDPYLVQENANTPIYSLDFKVADNATPGASANFGCPEKVCFDGRRTSYSYTRTVNTGTIGAGEIQPIQKYAVSVASTAATSILTPMSSQIRFKGVGSDGNFANYGNTFDVRTRATIAKADFDAKFTDEATAKAGITEFGFVYAAKSNVATFDYETAKAVAQGTPATDYVKYECNYMQRTAEGYNFTCLITNIPDADHNEVVNCIAYVCFNGEYIFFDAPASADYNALYTAYKK